MGSIPAWAGEPFSWRSVRIFRGVYPRVGGGTNEFTAQDSVIVGLSPRGRGNRHEKQAHLGY